MRKYHCVAWACFLAAMGSLCAGLQEGWRPKSETPDRLVSEWRDIPTEGTFGAFLADESFVGFFAKEWQGRPCYTLLCKEDGAYALCFVEFGKGSVRVPIEKSLGEDMEDILAYEIDNATDKPVLGVDGVFYAFGVKRGGRWVRATAWSPEGDFIPLMGEIARVPELPEKPGMADAVRKLVGKMKTLYVNDPRPEVNRAQVRRWQASMRQYGELGRGKDAAPAPAVRLKTTLECPPDGDLRVRVEAEGLPPDSDFEINTQETRCQICAEVVWKDAAGQTRRERLFRAWYPNLEYKMSPLGVHAVTLAEMTPVLRQMILGLCLDPSQLESVAVALSWGHFSSKRFSSAYYGIPIEVPMQALPIEALRKNLMVKSTPLSQRDQSAVLARDERGRLTRFNDRFGNRFECEYCDVPVPNPQRYLEQFKEIGAFAKDSYALREPVGVRRLLKNGELVREEGDLGDGVWYARGWGDYETYELCDYARRRNLRLWESGMRYTIMDKDARYGSLPQKSAEVAGARNLTPRQARDWMADFAALDAAVAFSDEGGTPALYLVLTNRSGRALMPDEHMKVDVSFMCGVEGHFSTGTSGGGGGAEAPTVQGDTWRFRIKDAWSVPGAFLRRGIDAGRLPAFGGISDCAVSLRAQHVVKDPRMGAIVFETAQITQADTPGLRTALERALNAAQKEPKPPPFAP